MLKLIALYGIGVVGSYVAWLAWVSSFHDYRTPTPRALVGMAICGVTVIIPWGLAAVWWLTLLAERLNERTKKTGSWWATPLGRKPKDQA